MSLSAASLSFKGPPFLLWSRRQGFFLALIMLLLAAFLRFTHLASLPQGISEDEIINIRLVDNVRQGDIFVFFPDESGGREGGYPVFAAFATALVGDGSIGFRMLSVWLGMLSLAIIYTLGNHLYNPFVGVAALALAAVNMSGILLSRTLSSDAAVALLVSATMLALARSLPVYRRTRLVTSNIFSFAALGSLLGAGLYVHPSSLFIAAGALAYIAHLVYIRNQMFGQRRSYTSFAILLLLIISMPYLISTINLFQYSGLQRMWTAFGDGAPRALLDGLRGIVLDGDINPAHNLPGRPLVDMFSGLAIAIGFVISALRRNRPRFAMPLFMFALLLPAALIVPGSPNFARMTVIMPLLALFFGVGLYALLRASIFADPLFKQMAALGALALLALNLVWTWQDLVADWRNNEAVMPAVNGELGQIAHYLDRVGAELPVVFCNPGWEFTQPSTQLSAAEKTLLMMNRDSLPYHEADCASALLLTDGGARQRLIYFDAAARDAVHPLLQDWLSTGERPVAGLPNDAIIELDTVERLAAKAGALTTTAPLSYAPEVAIPQPISPSIRFGGNLTLLGYEPDVPREFLPGDLVDVITYWRVDGEMPPDVTQFTHIMADPVTPIATRHFIGVNPLRMRARDIFIQVTQLRLPAVALPGEYTIAIGLYRENFDQRLPVLKAGQAPWRPPLPVYHPHPARDAERIERRLMFELVFLGTSASAPSIYRGLPAVAVLAGEQRFLVDCGEGTQRQILRSGIGFKRLNRIFLTHAHLDHILGLGGLLSTFCRWEAMDEIHIWGGLPAIQRVQSLVYQVIFRREAPPVPIYFNRVLPGNTLFRGRKFGVRAFPVRHRGRECYGYIFEEDTRRPFLADKADALGNPAGTGARAAGRRRVRSSWRAGALLIPTKCLARRSGGAKVVITGDLARVDDIKGCRPPCRRPGHRSHLS